MADAVTAFTPEEQPSDELKQHDTFADAVAADRLAVDHSVLRGNPTLEQVSIFLAEGRYQNVVCMVGAGISVSAGLPDFRSPNGGLYPQFAERLSEFGLHTPEDAFDIHWFRSHPDSFWKVEMTIGLHDPEGAWRPTATHYFMRLLHDKGVLLRIYTQNVDALEAAAGLPDDKVVYAHGRSDQAHCIECGELTSAAAAYASARAETLPRCDCGGLVKPRTVFFGEQLPSRFYQLRKHDMDTCDLLLVLGTSLKVHPFCGLLHKVGPLVPRVLINCEAVSVWSDELKGEEDAVKRDVLALGDADDTVKDVCGWTRWVLPTGHNTT